MSEQPAASAARGACGRLPPAARVRIRDYLGWAGLPSLIALGPEWREALFWSGSWAHFSCPALQVNTGEEGKRLLDILGDAWASARLDVPSVLLCAEGLAALEGHHFLGLTVQRLELRKNPYRLDTLQSATRAFPGLDTLQSAARAFPGTQHLVLHALPELTDAGLDCLASLSGLRGLDLVGCGAFPTSPWPNLQHLQSLSILYSRLKNSDLQLLVEGLPSLRHLTISRCDAITDEGLASLAKKLTELRVLRLEACWGLTSQGLLQLRELELDELHLCRWHRLTTVPTLDQAWLSNLQRLDLCECSQLTDDGLQNLLGQRNLQRLSVAHCRQLTDVGLAHLGTLTGLLQLDFSGCQLTDVGLAHLGTLTGLLQLDFSGCRGLTTNGLVQLLRRLPALEELKLGSCTQLAVSKLAELPAWSSLRRLALCDLWKLDLKGPQLPPNLEELDLGNSCWILDQWLAGLGALSQLRRLDLSHCRGLTNTGLANLQNLQALRRLDLSHCDNLTDDGLAQLPLGLEELDLSYSDRLTNAGLGHLYTRHKLQRLRLEGCHRLTHEAVAKLLRARPALQIGALS